MEKSQVQSRKVSPIIRRFLILIALPILMVAGVSASADQKAFTKWVTRAPSMAGFVGGADGDGSYAGEILKCTEGTTTVIEAIYYFDGAKLPFDALVHVEQTGMRDAISAVVTEG
jgi:hypothetical protein